MSKILAHRRKAFRGGIPTDGLIAEYLFDTDAGDTSGNGYNGTLNGDAAVSSGLLSLDGTGDYVSIADADDFSFTDGAGTDQAFSVSLWCKPTTAIGAGQVLVAKYYPSGNQREWVTQITGVGTFQIACYELTGDFIAAPSATAYTQNNWHHLVFTYDGSEANTGFTVYLDNSDDTGTPVSSGTYTGMSNGTQPVYIGAFQNSATPTYGAEFTGDMDNIRIYDRELSAAEVTQLYNEGHS